MYRITFSKSSADQINKFNRLKLNPRNFSPRKIDFLDDLSFIIFSASNGVHKIGLKRFGIFLCTFEPYEKGDANRGMPTYSDAHIEVKKWNFDAGLLPGNWF